MKILILIFLVAFAHWSLTLGQRVEQASLNSNKHIYLTVRLNKGLVIPHHSSMTYLINDFTRGGEITIGRRYFNQQHWTSLFNYPEIGFGLHYSTLGNNDVYGQGIALFHYINYTIYRSHKFTVQNKVAAGLGIMTKPFDINTNIYNDVSGSLFNVFVSLGINIDYRISKRFSLTLSSDVDHMSNGAFKLPNSGINIINTSLGTKYHFNASPTPVFKRKKPDKVNEHEIQVVANVGPSQSTPFDSRKYWNGNISICYLYKFNTKKALGIGFEQFYSKSAPYIWGDYYHRYVEKSYSNSDYFFNAIYASYNVFVGKTIMFMNLGAYLFTGTKPKQPVYPRIGLRHQLTKNLLVSFGIKASFFRSEFLEFGIGYRFGLFNKEKGN